MIFLSKFVIVLLIGIPLAVATPVYEQVSFFLAESASTRQGNCAECYEKYTTDNESQTCENTDQTGSQAGQDQRLSYEKVTDIFTSQRQQTLIHFTPGNDAQLAATERHADKHSMLQQAIYKPNQSLAGIEYAQSAINSGVINASTT